MVDLPYNHILIVPVGGRSYFLFDKLFNKAKQTFTTLYFVYSAECPGGEMVPRSDFPFKTSTPGESPEGITDESSPKWKPDDKDVEPTITIAVSDKESVFIEVVTVDAEGVTKITVTVKDENGKEVVSNLSTTFEIFVALWHIYLV